MERSVTFVPDAAGGYLVRVGGIEVGRARRATGTAADWYAHPAVGGQIGPFGTAERAAGELFARLISDGLAPAETAPREARQNAPSGDEGEAPAAGAARSLETSPVRVR